MLFCSLATTRIERIDADEAAFQFMHPLADRRAVPSQQVLRSPLPAFAQFFYRLRINRRRSLPFRAFFAACTSLIMLSVSSIPCLRY